MTYRDILETAIAMVGEEIGSSDNADYEESAPYLLATLCRECADLDNRYRLSHGESEKVRIPSVACVDLDAVFPLSDALISPACYYLAALLTMDENEEVSDKYFSLYTDSLAVMSATLPMSSRSVTDRYGLLT